MYFLNVDIGGGLVQEEHAFGLYDRRSLGRSYSWISRPISQSHATIHYSYQFPRRTSYATFKDVHTTAHCLVAYLR